MNEAACSRSHEYYSVLPAPLDGKSQDVTLPSSGECESDPLLQEQMANAVELYDLTPVHSTGPQSGPMDVDASVNVIMMTCMGPPCKAYHAQYFGYDPAVVTVGPWGHVPIVYFGVSPPTLISRILGYCPLHIPSCVMALQGRV